MTTTTTTSTTRNPPVRWAQRKDSLFVTIDLQGVKDPALEVTAGIARHAQTDSAELLQRLEAIAARGERTRTIYRAAAAAQPLPANCAPGQARVDAINQALGPTSRIAK